MDSPARKNGEGTSVLRLSCATSCSDNLFHLDLQWPMDTTQIRSLEAMYFTLVALCLDGPRFGLRGPLFPTEQFLYHFDDTAFTGLLRNPIQDIRDIFPLARRRKPGKPLLGYRTRC